MHRFVKSDNDSDIFLSQTPGFYAILEKTNKNYLIKYRRGTILTFEEPSKRGRLYEFYYPVIKTIDGGDILSVIDQGYAYLALLLNYKAEFILVYNEMQKGSLRKNDVDWTQSRVIFISPFFTTYERKAIDFKDLPIELWEVKLYSNNTILFNQIRSPEQSESVKKISQKSDVIRAVNREVKQGEVILTNDVFIPSPNMVFDYHRSENKTLHYPPPVESSSRTERASDIKEPKSFHVEQLKYYMSILGAEEGYMIYQLLMHFEETPFKAFRITMNANERKEQRDKLVREINSLKKAMEAVDPSIARCVSEVPDLNWLCNDCPYLTDCKRIQQAAAGAA